MIELLLLFAAAAAEPTPAEPGETPPITVRGAREAEEDNPITVRGRRPSRIQCRSFHNSAETRIRQTPTCLTLREWDEVRDQARELLADLPRRNPPTGNMTSPILPQ